MTDFNLFTFNSRVWPGTEPLVVKKGDRVRVRLGNLSMDSHRGAQVHVEVARRRLQVLAQKALREASGPAAELEDAGGLAEVAMGEQAIDRSDLIGLKILLRAEAIVEALRLHRREEAFTEL